MKNGFRFLGLSPTRKTLAVLALTLMSALLAGSREQSKPGDGRTAGTGATDYREMSRILFKYRPRIDYNELHARYRDQNPARPFSCVHRYALTRSPLSRASAGQPRSALSRVLVIVNAPLYADKRARGSIDRYLRDIHKGYDCTVELMTSQGGSPEDIKRQIQARFYQGDLDGVVFIGRLPAAWYEIANDHAWYQGGYGYADWTCDLFFMDLDGSWDDADADGKYDFHRAGAGDLAAEIFVGRIDASAMGAYGTEVDLLCRYLDKDHEYWSGRAKLYRYGLAYIDRDWVSQGAGYFGMLYGTGAYQNLMWQAAAANQVEKNDYLNNRLPVPYYGFTQVWSHASHQSHYFYAGGSCFESEVHSRHPKSIGYNIDGCHAGDWAAAGGAYFLSGGYLYNESPSSLTVISTTKSGGMLGFEPFYRRLGQNACMGDAFLFWLNQRLASSDDREYIIGWHYGMVAIGDPLIAFLEVPGLDKSVTVAPPTRLSGVRTENRSLFLRENLDVLTWQANPKNETENCSGYRIYGLAGNTLVRLGEVGREQSQYACRTSNNRSCLYAVATLDRSGLESDLAFTTVR